MKREFLQNLKVNDQPLSKEVIDAIMAENGRDIEAAKKPFEDYGTIKQQLSDAQTALADIKKDGQTIEAAQQKAQEWETKYNKAIEDHKQEMANMAFDRSLESAITGAKGKNAKAIKALLDVENLQKSNNQEADIKAALEALKKDSGYLFDTEAAPPYSAGAGSGTFSGKYDPQTAAIRAAAGLKNE